MVKIKKILSISIIFIILSSVLVLTPVSGDHENPDEVEEDLGPFFESLNRTSEVMGRSLEEALKVNYSVYEAEDGNLTYEYEEEILANSTDIAGSIERELAKPDSVFADIEGEIESYGYLEEYVVPLHSASINLTLYSKRHRYLVSNLTYVFLEDTEGERTTREAFNNTHDHITHMYESLEGVNETIQNIEDDVNLAGLELLIEENYRLLGEYEEILEYVGRELEYPPILFIYGPEKAHPSQEFEIKVNYFDCESFNTSADISLLMDEERTDLEYELRQNSYIFSYQLDWTSLISSELNFSARVDESEIVSKELSVQIVPYNSRIELETDSYYYDHDEIITVTGIFKTDAEIDLTEIDLHAPEKNISLDEEGSFVLEYDSKDFRWGESEINVEYEGAANDTLSPSSGSVTFEVSVPTDIIISEYTETVRYEESDFRLDGRLINISNEDEGDLEGLGSQDLKVHLDGETIAENQTDEDGYFTFSSPGAQELETGTYLLEITFEGSDKYRSAETGEIRFEVVEEEPEQEMFWSNPLLLGGIAISIFVILGSLYFISSKKEDKEVPESITSAQEGGTSEVTIPEASGEEEITTAYRSLLERMQELGFVKLSKGKTHREIENEINSHPRTAENKREMSFVTNIFEKALFTDRKIVQSEIERFNSSLSRLMKEVPS
ncbi:MAG: carboxypeptidase-like regulatory domain-containing protein [Candidatus Aenigmatarchaeota archaeon]